MVQVDVFWSYSLGASFAAAAARQLEKEESPFINKYFIYTILYLACIFAPSGIYLLWNFPHWETMQVASTHGDLPAWLVVGFSVTNITQGILGFLVSWFFIKRGRFLAAHMQWFIGYFFMFFILIYGWDGTGWQRFLYDATVSNGVLWTEGTHMGFAFLCSNVAMTLLGMGFFVMPFLVWPMIKWISLGALLDPDVPQDKIPSSKALLESIAMGIFVLGLGSAAGTAILAGIIGKIVGSPLTGAFIAIPVFFVIARFFLFKKGQPGYKIFEKLFIQERIK